MMSKEQFFTKRLDKKKGGGWTGVYAVPVDGKGKKLKEVMLTAFGGADNGAESAARYVQELQAGVNRFYVPDAHRPATEQGLEAAARGVVADLSDVGKHVVQDVLSALAVKHGAVLGEIDNLRDLVRCSVGQLDATVDHAAAEVAALARTINNELEPKAEGPAGALYQDERIVVDLDDSSDPPGVRVRTRAGTEIIISAHADGGLSVRQRQPNGEQGGNFFPPDRHAAPAEEALDVAGPPPADETPPLNGEHTAEKVG